MKTLDGISLRVLGSVPPGVIPVTKAADNHAVAGNTSAGVARTFGAHSSTTRGSFFTTSNDPPDGSRSSQASRTRPWACTQSNPAFARRGD